MDDALGRILTAGGVFAGSNVDDLVVLTLLVVAARAGGRPLTPIWLGQYLGIGTLVAVAGLAAAGLTIVPDRWVGLLGLVPLALGVRGLWAAARARADDQPPAPLAASGVLAVAGVTIANGADNLSLYAPLFRSIGLGPSLVTVAVFAVLTAVWCAAGAWLGGHRPLVAVIARWSHWLVPAVLAVVGAVIVVESGVLGRIAGG
ncbi:cadmium resistance transporter [Patulibacter defluvii]|uniref:cadmium resistance transporter n=1 Tax=Patulibacter defluvii TaxID=3095358 RepID=UPI002A762D21|nr:cadmium resistance transporter [Patulibacter sp. DM4]